MRERLPGRAPRVSTTPSAPSLAALRPAATDRVRTEGLHLNWHGMPPGSTNGANGAPGGGGKAARKYDRQLRVWGEAGQERLESSRAVLLGCGPR